MYVLLYALHLALYLKKESHHASSIGDSLPLSGICGLVIKCQSPCSPFSDNKSSTISHMCYKQILQKVETQEERDLPMEDCRLLDVWEGCQVSRT